MDISTHTLATTHPVDLTWIDEALAGLDGTPLGAIVGRPLVERAPGLLIALWPDGAAPRGHDGGADGLRLTTLHTGQSTGPARYAHVVRFHGPRDDTWAAAEERAGTERLWPAVRGLDGIVRVMRARGADNAQLTVIMAESVEALEEGARAVMSTTLLPGEDPALLTGPDEMAIYRLVHVDLDRVAAAGVRS